MATTYTVKKGDTLPQIAENYKDVIRDENGNLISTNKARTNYLAKINDINSVRFKMISPSFTNNNFR